MDLSAITYSVFIPMLYSIHEFAKSIGLDSFAWAIILLTAVVKLVLTPLTFKQIKSTRKMQLVQPQLKKLQDDFKKKEEKLKTDPGKLNQERLEFQQKMMGFYKDNGINPLGGCLPLLLQMPILLGLFWTFSGPPFKEKPLYVDVKVVSKAEANKKEAKAFEHPEIFVDAAGNKGRFALNHKKIVMVEGETYDIILSRTMGDVEIKPEDIQWKFFGDQEKAKSEISLDVKDGFNVSVTGLKAGSSHKIEALLPRTLVDDCFFFIKDFGDTGVFDAHTGKFNWDIFILASLFGFSIWLSTKLNSPQLPPAPKSGEEEDPQVAIQRSMATMMPIMMTAMMFMIPLPAGALLYMLVSSYIQVGQTYFATKRYDKQFQKA
jgi:YidC/Oxa1 family membrane protein insertase